MDSLIPSFSLYSNIPIFFIEARVGGSTKELVSQLGISMNINQCDVSLTSKHYGGNQFLGISGELDISTSSFILSLFFLNNKLTYTAKTSGALVVVGISSYCVYKLCGKFLEKKIILSLLDSRPLNVTGESKIFSLNSKSSSIFDVSEDIYTNIITSSETEKESDEEVYESEVCTIKKYHFNLSFPKKDYRKKGLTALSIMEADEKNDQNRKDIIEKACSLSRFSSSPSSSINFMDSKKFSVFRNKDKIKYDNDDGNDIDSSSVSVKSATFNLAWDTEPTWDDEFYNTSEIVNQNRLSSSDISCETESYNSVGLLLRNILDYKIDDEDSIFNLQQQSPLKADTIDGLGSELNSIVMEDLSTMINSKCGSEFGKSKSSSIHSFMTDNSNLSKLKEKTSINNIKGLIELSPMTENDISVKNGASISRTQLNSNPFNSPMTDSLFSKESFVSSNTTNKNNYQNSLNQKVGQMFDSAIVSDYFNDEEIRSLPSTNNNVNNNIIRLSNLTQINETDLVKTSDTSIKNLNNTGSFMTKSVQSLEWCDDDIIFEDDNSFKIESLNNNSALKNEHLKNLNIDIDYATFQLFPELSPTKSFSSESHYSLPHSITSNKSNDPKKSTNISNISGHETILGPINDLRLKSTRDFMVVIRENFKFIDNNNFKLANILYSKKRLRRIRYFTHEKNDFNTIDNFLENILHSMVYSNASFFNCSSFSAIQKVS
ncbi:Hypothetical protein SRAE_0000002200 [Strongyloides ratti]|uniref:Uncharacterized protein n=1 Tax=Strongyloides ratti TaxID=34506 RepID=A0A090KTP1_STRRB|nr:Hypothetical protein SRAE_0000002200 [Strongyloides ratti]CEF60890.1 Hypothetical protein SRAE_0000002200 [Strongyloides ratti]